MSLLRERDRLLRRVHDLEEAQRIRATTLRKLAADRDRYKLERDGLLERREAADQIHDETMRGWANTSAERDRYREALESIALAPSAVADLRARAALDAKEGTP